MTVIKSKAFIDQLKSIVRNLDENVSLSVKEIGELGQAQAKATNNYKDVSGTLRNSKTNFIQNGQFSGKVVANTFYAYWVNNGNGGAGTKIYPKRAKALRFVINGKVFFRKWVRVMGEGLNSTWQKGWMDRTYEYIEQIANTIVAKNFSRLIKK